MLPPTHLAMACTPSHSAQSGRPPSEPTRRPTTVSASRPVSRPLALDLLGERGLLLGAGDIYYFDALTFACPALEAVAAADELGIRWLGKRLALARDEQQQHLRLCQHVQEGGWAPWCRQAFSHVVAAAATGLTGGLNFGTFAMAVAQVNAALHQAPGGFGLMTAGRFSASAAGRQVISNLLGALPGGFGYAVCSGLTATVLRPLIDAVALLLSGGQLTPVVAVDPALVYPMPLPVDAWGRPKSGAAYRHELQAMAQLRKAMARQQAQMLDQAESFNLKYGTPLFAAFHAIRVMYQISLLLQKQSAPTATMAAALSALSSACGSFGLQLGAGAERLRVTVEVRPGVHLPLFMPRGELARLRGEPSSLRRQVRLGFTTAGRHYVRHAGVVRKLAWGLPASALAVNLATVFINGLLPLGSLLAERSRGWPAAGIATAGAVALAAFVLTYLSLCKALRHAARVVCIDPVKRRNADLAHAFRLSLERFMQVDGGERKQGAEPVLDRAHAGRIAAAIDAMNQAVLRGLDNACRQEPDPQLEPGALLRLRDAYRDAADRVRPCLLPSDSVPSQSTQV